MPVITVDNRSPAFDSYRANRVKSLFNATDDQATRFAFSADLPLPDDWSIGVIAGPSGSGKTSMGRELWGADVVYDAERAGWPDDAPIVDAIAPGGDFDAVTAALAQAGLGDVPAWLRPYRVLSTGQKFRADLARLLAEAPDRVVFDEFTSVVDRQIACVGAGAFAKAWRRTGGQAVLLTCHYDVLNWVEPDWVFDTATRNFQTKECLQHRRPRIDVEVRMGGWDLWPFFKPHHYLDSANMIGAKCYVGFVDGEPVVHLGMGTKNVTVKSRRGGRPVSTVEARACRMVTLPEWQGAGMRVVGGSIYHLTDRVDGGPIAYQRHLVIPPGISASALWADHLFPLGVELARTAIQAAVSGQIPVAPQDDRLATWEPSFDSEPLYRPELLEIGR